MARRERGDALACVRLGTRGRDSGGGDADVTGTCFCVFEGLCGGVELHRRGFRLVRRGERQGRRCDARSERVRG
eukprot:470075-Pleurochrysis_carterae.AAC.1